MESYGAIAIHYWDEDEDIMKGDIRVLK